MKKWRRGEGFTLVELLVIISIMAVLSSVILAFISNTRTRAFDSKYFSEIKQMRLAMELYKSNNGNYPIASGDTTDQTLGWDTSVYTDYNPTANGNNLGNFLATLTSAGSISRVPHYNGWVSGAAISTNPVTWMTYIRNANTASNGRAYYSCSPIVTNANQVLGKTMIILGYGGVMRGFPSSSANSNSMYVCKLAGGVCDGTFGGGGSTAYTSDQELGQPAGTSLICMPLD